ncbi:SH3 and multiple ankyrin repeat domains protein 2 [Galemys pyrenaicus]|uniref:SH3 and multiple ankyrin repeat domains protein 2 n=1 Tax=Galemys pyrenaicus TaxID=202257 RepID=A0A8J6DVR0_GALPY|nr:SH3 and multiple ankyrin repeat domains protein 2 [Galemys pyrenaicus]
MGRPQGARPQLAEVRTHRPGQGRVPSSEEGFGRPRGRRACPSRPPPAGPLSPAGRAAPGPVPARPLPACRVLLRQRPPAGPVTPPCGCPSRSPEVASAISGTRSTTVTFTVRPGTSQPITLQSRPPDYESRTSGTRRAPSPVVSPTEVSKEMLPAPLPAAPPAAGLPEAFSLPSQPPSGDLFGLSPAGRSRSPSPSILQQPVPNKPFTSKPVHLWTKPDVADWLESLNLGEHREAFMDNEIDGSHLPNLQKEDLIDLGVTRVGHRMNIERALKQLLDR